MIKLNNACHIAIFVYYQYSRSIAHRVKQLYSILDYCLLICAAITKMNVIPIHKHI